jgi:hypothetical protein
VIASGGQVIGGGTTGDSSAQMDIQSTTRGALIPRLTTAQMNAILSPVKGLLVYNTDASSLYQYNGATWAAVGGGVTTLSGLTIDADKDWQSKKINNCAEIQTAKITLI